MAREQVVQVLKRSGKQVELLEGRHPKVSRGKLLLSKF